ncbi:DUF305 domain-containing protein [Pseudomonas sp. IT-196MI5]|uniref:hypothetical protein n=1 Tax=Pseudomonas sp. IT-196MI5 TaxID=3026440 RepID=UPI0039E19F5B
MRHRGTGYWLWTNTRLPFQTYEEVLGNGVQVEVRARISPLGFAQVFIGIYGRNGWAISEESHDRQSGEPRALALRWGVARAGEIVLETQAFVAPHRVQLALGPVITDESVLALRCMEMTERERLKLKSDDAWIEYQAAKASVLTLMRSTKVDPGVWAEQKERLRQAIDRRACVQRAYLSCLRSMSAAELQ